MSLASVVLSNCCQLSALPVLRVTSSFFLYVSRANFMRGMPSISVFSFNAFLGQGQLMHIHKTLDNIQRRSAQRSQQHHLEQERMYAADLDTVSLRAQVNARCEPRAHIDYVLRIAVHTGTNPDITQSGESASVVHNSS